MMVGKNGRGSEGRERLEGGIGREKGRRRGRRRGN